MGLSKKQNFTFVPITPKVIILILNYSLNFILYITKL